MSNSFYLLGVQFLLLLHSYTSSKVIAPISFPISPSPAYSLRSFNVVKTFGAKNDGKTDATQAFRRAWKAACASSIPSQIYVPHGTYLLRPIIFEGNNCKLDVLFRIDGTLIAHNVTYRNETWIGFHNVDGLHIMGGILDAQGKTIWDCKEGHARLMRCLRGAKSLSFEGSKNVIVDGLTSRNSQMFHITINACENIHMGGVTITADGDSPNTDGIHMEKSKGIKIMHSQIMTGDDCISIGPNSHNIWVENVFCGPGHGISIGSLGRLSDEGVVVQNVTVKSVTFIGTYNGLRIKTFSTPIYGIVKDIYFLGVTIIDVRYPIIIDQNYCPHGICPRAQDLLSPKATIRKLFEESMQRYQGDPVWNNELNVAFNLFSFNSTKLKGLLEVAYESHTVPQAANLCKAL
ncbi:polygalacturonase-like [Silene latifolia]|uniref:polygalacturonase-like n=1 Tax=Silene latifolia TaxID=37657 RepID=UPI003D77C91D